MQELQFPSELLLDSVSGSLFGPAFLATPQQSHSPSLVTVALCAGNGCPHGAWWQVLVPVDAWGPGPAVSGTGLLSPVAVTAPICDVPQGV